MAESGIGLRVQIKIEEDGSSDPPSLPLGTIVRSMIGSDGEVYYLVHLDVPVKTRHVKTGGQWVLQNLAIAPNFKGGTLLPIYHSRDKYVPVGIINIFELPAADDPILDFSKGEYFATGRVYGAE